MSLSTGEWVFVVLIGLMLVFAVASNGLVCYCVYKFRKLRNVTNVFICNLAVSDVLLAGVLMPQKLHDISHTEEFYEGQFLCKLVNFAPIFLITSSIYTLVSVSFERRRAVIDSGGPQMTIKSLTKILPAVWLFSLLVSVPTMIEYRVNEITTSEDNTTRTLLSCDSQHTTTQFSVSNAIFVVLVSYALPVVLMFKNYFQISLFVWKRGRQIQIDASDRRSVANLHLFKGRVKIVKLLVVVAVIFAVSWLPFFIMLLYAKITGRDASGNASGFVNLFLITMATFSTAYNVILYVAFNPNFSRAIRQVLRCASRPGETGQSLLQQTQMEGVSTIARQGPSTAAT